MQCCSVGQEEVGQLPRDGFLLSQCRTRPCLNTCAKRSSIPLVAEWYGTDLMCLMPFLPMNVLNSSAVNWGLLLLTSCSVKPYVANSSISSSIVLVVLVVVFGTASGHLESVHNNQKHCS